MEWLLYILLTRSYNMKAYSLSHNKSEYGRNGLLILLNRR